MARSKDQLTDVLQVEYDTLVKMTRIYCSANCHAGACPCGSCSELLAYAARRLARCPYGDIKPTCAKCPIHCYSRDNREQVRQIMRYAGPRMLFRHPITAVRHLLHSRKPVPERPRRKKANQ